MLFLPCRTPYGLMSFPFVRRCLMSSHAVGKSPQLSGLLHSNIQTRGMAGHHKVMSLRLRVEAGTCRHLQTTSVATQSESPNSNSKNEQLLSQMNIRLVNENSFLSWCRNAYMSTVVGVAMMSEGASALTQSAGLGAFMVGTMNLTWGTGCHVTNLVRLRHVSGMSTVTLCLHVAGSVLHCCLWAFVLICYIGFLDETRWPAESTDSQEGRDDGTKKRGLGEGLRRV